ncbi:MAG: hypothetical protein H7Y13_07065 [Sphingobacteriaceae bacterium]|nr:hypothetical protein [Sphingobacteriaceae bacterium]
MQSLTTVAAKKGSSLNFFDNISEIFLLLVRIPKEQLTSNLPVATVFYQERIPGAVCALLTFGNPYGYKARISLLFKTPDIPLATWPGDLLFFFRLLKNVVLDRTNIGAKSNSVKIFSRKLIDIF